MRKPWELPVRASEAREGKSEETGHVRRGSDCVCEGSGCTEIKPFPVPVPSTSHRSVRILYRKLSGATCHHVQLDVCWRGKGEAPRGCTVSWADTVLQVHNILAVPCHLPPALQRVRRLCSHSLAPSQSSSIRQRLYIWSGPIWTPHCL